MSTFNFNGKQFQISNVADVKTDEGTSGIALVGAPFFILGKYKAYIKITFKDSTPEEIKTFGGFSVMGIGNRRSAINEYKAECQELYNLLGRYIVNKYAQEIIDGAIKIDIFSRQDGIAYRKNKLIPKEDFSHCIFNNSFDKSFSTFHIYSKDGTFVKHNSCFDDHFFNLCVPEIMNLLYK